MTFHQWLRKVFGFRVRASRASRRGKFGQPSRRHLGRTRLNLEPLEDRTLLSAPVTTTSGLINAIVAANTAGGSTTITLASGTTFNFTSANNLTNGSNALPVINAINNHASITIVGNGDTIERTGTNAFRLFDVASGGSLTLQNLTLSGGSGGGGAGGSGAYFVSGSSGGTGGFGGGGGGGGYGSNGSGHGGNGGFGGGGGGAAGGQGTASTGGYGAGAGGSGKILSARAGYAGSGGGGGAGMGGAVFNEAGNVTITNSTLYGNTAQGGAGGTGYNGGNGTAGEGLGGALFNHDGTITVANSTISANTATQGDGSTLTAAGRGIFNLGSGLVDPSNPQLVTINNTIIGQSDTTVQDLTNAGYFLSVFFLTSGNGNLIRGYNGVASKDFTIVSTADPHFDPNGLQLNGGPTRTVALQLGSPAINGASAARASPRPISAALTALATRTLAPSSLARRSSTSTLCPPKRTALPTSN